MTIRHGRILIMDDLERWRNELSDALSDTAYEVETAATRQEALERYQSGLFHVLILDIQMDDRDDRNDEGLELLNLFEEASRSNAVRIIICSGYGKVRDRIPRSFRHGAEDFVDKNEFSDAQLIEFVDRSFDEKLKINLDLEILWQQGLRPETAVQNLLVGEKRIKKNSPEAELVAAELEDLLCRLFHDARSLLVEPLTSGRSGAGVLLVQPFYEAGAGRSVVVKFGDYQQIDLEYQHFRQHVRPFVGGGRSTTVLDLRRTPRLGGMVYSFMGNAEGGLQDFESFYRSHDEKAIVAVLDELFHETCAAWYANLGQVRPLNLTEHYADSMDLRSERLESARRDRLKSVQGKQQLVFESLTEARELPNPIPVLTEESWILSTYECITHGDFNPHNILIDPEGHTWLIDFQQTGPGHLLRDLIQLDCAVRFEMLSPEQATLDERLTLEEALLALPGFPTAGEDGKGGSFSNPALRKPFVICRHLRAIAGQLLSNNPAATMKEFEVGAAYFSLNYLRFYSFPQRVREHALLSASLLAHHLRGRG